MTPYLVYRHIDPFNNEIVYVGMGTLDRPWQVNNRSKEHTEWLRHFYNQTGSLESVVKPYAHQLSKMAALELELELITHYKPKFNKNYDYPLVTLTKEGFEKAKYLRETGNSYSTIARQLQVSTMTIYRALNGETKAYDKYTI